MLVVLVTLAATIFMQTGYFLWKLASDSLPRIGEVSTKEAVLGFLTNGKWMLGMGCTTLGWLLFIKATDLGEISIVQPLMSVGDLFLVLLAVLFLGERLNRNEWLGLAMTVIGAIVLSFDAKVTPPLQIDWTRLMLLMLFLGMLGGAVYWLARRSRRPEVLLAIAVGFGFGVGAVLTELMTANITMGGQTVESIAGFFNPVLPFVIGANMLGLILLQIAFQKGRAAVIIPVQLSVANGIVVLVGMLVFAEAISLYRLFAIALMVAGTGWLHRGDSGKPAQP